MPRHHLFNALFLYHQLVINIVHNTGKENLYDIGLGEKETAKVGAKNGYMNNLNFEQSNL